MMPRKVAVVGIGGTFPTCKDTAAFGEKLFTNQSLIREWDEAVAHGKKMRSTVSGYTSVTESGLEAIPSSILVNYPEIFKDKLERIPVENLSTADLGSIWAMLGAQEAIKMSGWTEK